MIKGIKILLCLFCLLAFHSANSQLDTVYVEFVADDSFGLPNYPEGYTTYRLYAEFETSDIYVISMYGLSCSPMYINTTGDFFNSEFAGITGSGVNPALIEFYPEIEYDSWVTVGSFDSTTDIVSTAQSDGSPIADSFDTPNGTSLDFADGAIYLIPNESDPTSSGYPVGPDNKILLGQFTTNGCLSYKINIQVFPDGTGPDATIVSSLMCDENLDNAIVSMNQGLIFDGGYCSDPLAVNYDPDPDEGCENDDFCFYAEEGCTDPLAENYNPNAVIDDGTCIYFGCVDPEACNFWELATIDDGSCLYDCFGCLDETALNYNPDASIDDGSCFFEFAYLTIEEVYSDDNTVEGYPAGYTTYQLYLWGQFDDDVVTSIFDNELTDSILVSSTGTIWNDLAEGSAQANMIDTNLFAGIPSLRYDSWVTLGCANGNDFCNLTLDGGPNPDSLDPLTESSNDDLILHDASWFAVFGSSNTIVSEDNSILIGQITTNGQVCASINAEMYAHGDEAFAYNALNVSACGPEIFGCTDPEASNFNPLATQENGTCDYTCANEFIEVLVETQSLSNSLAWEIINIDTDSIYISEYAPLDDSLYLYQKCWEDGCYRINMINNSSNPFGWNNTGYEVLNSGNVEYEGTLVTGNWSFDFFEINGNCPQDGCTDPNAFNYDIYATVEDSSCYGQSASDNFPDNILPEFDADVFINPITGEIEISFENASKNHPFIFSIFTTDGRQTYREEFFVNAIDDILTSKRILKPGVYFWTLTQRERKLSKQFVIIE